MRNRYILLADLVAIFLAAWGAFAFRFGWLFVDTRTEFQLFLVIAIVVKVVTFTVLGLYRRYWEYGNFWDLMAVVAANAGASLIFAAVMIFIRLHEGIDGLSRSVLPIDCLLTLALTTGARASVRVFAESRKRRRYSHVRRVRRVLVVGAGDAGAMVVREMARNPQLGIEPIGFLDDDPSKKGKRIYGLPVLGSISALEQIAAQQPIDEVVIALPRAGGATMRAVAEMCREAEVPSRVMPGVYELLDGQVSVSRLRDVDIADLLRRPQVMTQISGAEYLKDRCVIVTGAGGSIGSELCRQVAHSQPSQLILVGHGENSIFQIAGELRRRFPGTVLQSVIADVRDRERLKAAFEAFRPDIIFHAAAHKHVPLMEENVAEAISNNVIGTRNVVGAAVAAGVPRLVLVSTDKAVAPNNVMGASKRVCEMIVRDAARRFNRAYVVVRFGNVLGSRGSVVPIFKEQIESGGPVTVTHHDVRRYFMTIPEAVHLILEAGGLGRGGELFVLDMGEPVYLRDLAADMIRLSGLSADEVPVVFTGLRPGEKLDELLWEEGSSVLPTERPDVRAVIEPGIVAADRLGQIVEELAAAAASDDRLGISRLLHEAIPSATWTLPEHAQPRPATARDQRASSANRPTLY